MEVEGKNHYQILGVGVTATVQEITMSYKRLAMKWHPDRNPDKTDHSTHIFKRISEAYTVLTDETKRSIYDANLNGSRSSGHYQQQQQSRPFGFGGYGFYDYYEGPSERQPKKGSDIRVDVKLDAAKAISGGIVEVETEEYSQCGDCKDILMQQADKQCYWCHGTGMDIGRVCHCVRSNKVVKKKLDSCKKCNGRGLETHKKKWQVNIPAGVQPSDELVIRGKGSRSAEGGMNGDLKVRIRIELPPSWLISGLDFTCNLMIPFPTAYLGGAMMVELPTGKTISMTIPANTQANTEFKLTGEGLFDGKKKIRGDVRITAIITLPSSRRKVRPEEEAVLRKLFESTA